MRKIFLFVSTEAGRGLPGNHCLPDSLVLCFLTLIKVMEWNSFKNSHSEIEGGRWGGFISVEQISIKTDLVSKWPKLTVLTNIAYFIRTNFIRTNNSVMVENKRHLRTGWRLNAELYI